MPGFDAIIDQERPIRVLTSLLTSGKIPHGLLFTGIEGIGKRTAATAFAQACNCTGWRSQGGGTVNACGECASCRKIAMDRHPDLLRVSPSGQLIKIDDVRDLCRSLAMKPYEARMRVAIIGEAHRMNPAAANALLKMLEEPPAGTVLILTAPQTADLPPTIVSRCQMVRFKPLSRNHLAGMLVAAHGFSPQEAALTAALANGSVTRALAMQHRHWIRRRNWILSELAELPRQPAVLLLALAERMSQAKDDIPAILDVLDAWVRDVTVARHCPERIIHHDLRGQILSAAHRTDVPCLIQAARALAEARRRLQANANPRLTLEALLIKMAPAFQAATSA